MEVKLRKPKALSNKFLIVLEEVDLENGLRVVVTDSDTYDRLTYIVDGQPMASEYVGDYKSRLKQVQEERDEFIDKLRCFFSSNVNVNATEG